MWINELSDRVKTNPLGINCDVRERFKKKNSKKKLTNVSFVCVCVGRKWSNVSFFLEFFSPNYSLIDNSLSE